MSKVSMSMDDPKNGDREVDCSREVGKLRVIWRLLEEDCTIDRSSRARPHWNQFGTLNFITIHLNDSVPKKVVQSWLSMQQAWLENQGLGEIGIEEFALRNDIPRPLKRAFQKMRREGWENELDECHGACPLRHPENAQKVAETLLHFDGVRYDLERFVVMPNHVHALAQMRIPWKVREQCASWMRYSARRINEEYQSRVVSFAEPFDHLVRNEKQFDYLRRYIQENPARARLQSSEYLLWISGSGYVK